MIYRGRSAPLRRLAGRVRTVAPIGRPSLLPGGFNGRVQANLAHIDQVNALEDGEGGESVEGPSAPKAAALPADLSAPGVLGSWEGANSYANDWSFNGNQFSVEPPDQGLCAGNGDVFETVNQVIQIYDHDGTPLLYGTPFFPGSPPRGSGIERVLRLSTQSSTSIPACSDRSPVTSPATSIRRHNGGST